MALRALVLRKTIDDLQAQLNAMSDADLLKTEGEVRKSLEELTPESTEEERSAVEEASKKADAARADYNQKRAALEEKIRAAQAELGKLEEEQSSATEAKKEREERTMPVTRNFATRAIRNMNMEERDSFAQREDVHSFAENIRSLAGAQNRSVTGADLLIPETILPMLYDEIYGASKLMPVVNRVSVRGKARQTIAGKIPEAIWQEMFTALKELSISFSSVEVDAYKVGGYIVVNNEYLQDSDINLVDEVLSKISQGIALAVDKAIVYGTGTKMPTGFAATATKANVAGKTDIALYKAFIEATGSLKHANGSLFWVANHKTRTKLVVASMSINAAGAIVAGTQNQMPIIGGQIIELDFVPDDEVLGGYGKDYILAERQGASLATSTDYKFVEDQTVFRGVARYDGKPVFVDGFICVGLGATDPTAAIDPAHKFAGVE